ncbi:MAG TPA: helix-turn-helix transcriptional regulator [Xanthobacteraceae bacterium]|nr:helix-turn-helix transcriptional regulator [Xanthobacteraceae bacterium]
MATRPRGYLYIQEHMQARGLSDEKVGEILGVARETIWRRRTEQHRLNPKKIAELAHAIGVEPEDLYRPPDRPSVDAMLKDVDQATFETSVDIVRRLIKKP